MTITIDLNCDAGEDPGAIDSGHEESLLRLVTSVNVACGAHAGDERTMDTLARLCARHATAFNAHPSYPDRDNFGRVPMAIDTDALLASLREQLQRAHTSASAHGLRVARIKPHGALYHGAARDQRVAHALAHAPGTPTAFVLPPTLTTRAVFEDAGHTVICEGFTDRAYRADGTLVPRTEAGALIDDPSVAARQALRLAREGGVRTICVHSDTPNALAIAAAVRETLTGAGVVLAP
ncbi:MAG: 5-oxoprolinase subunit PxpA [Phycisphaerales bacterium]